MASADGHFIKPVSDQTVDAFRVELPGLPTAELCRIAEVYQSIGSDVPTRAGPLRKELAALERQVSDLAQDLEDLDFASSDAIAVAHAKHGGPGKLELMQSLRAFRSLIWMTERYAPEPKMGRPPSPREWLVNALADLMEREGFRPDAARKGRLVSALRICLDHAGERVARPDVVVANFLKHRA